MITTATTTEHVKTVDTMKILMIMTIIMIMIMTTRIIIMMIREAKEENGCNVNKHF